jgi:predicted DNA-binding antitoxin AbrB/MazE fold protein
LDEIRSPKVNSSTECRRPCILIDKESLMKRSVEAVYEHGILRPFEPLDLSEGVEVLLTISEEPALLSLLESCYEVAERAGIIGALDGLPADLSTDRRPFESMGK